MVTSSPKTKRQIRYSEISGKKTKQAASSLTGKPPSVGTNNGKPSALRTGMFINSDIETDPAADAKRARTDESQNWRVMSKTA